MKNIDFKENIAISAIQLTWDNPMEVQKVIMDNNNNVSSIGIERDIDTVHGFGRSFITTPRDLCIEVTFWNKSSITVSAGDWVVILVIDGVKHMSVYTPMDFNAIFHSK